MASVGAVLCIAAVKAEVERLLAAMSPGVEVETAQIAEVPALAARNDSAAVAIARTWGALWPPGEIPFGTEAGSQPASFKRRLACC